MTAPDGPINLVRLGIKDANPERVLRHWEHCLLGLLSQPGEAVEKLHFLETAKIWG
jgi:hypothetical protein